jgi:hypothetical protein
MAFTAVTVTGSYGWSATGSLTFTLAQAMSNADTILLPQPLVATLLAGSFSQLLQANTDPGTVPQGVMWGVTEQITGAQPRDYFIEVPAIVTETDGTTSLDSEFVQLNTATAALWMAGLPITGTGIPDDTTIVGIYQNVNQLELSNPATMNGTSVTFTIGTSMIDISQLIPAAQPWT